MNKLQWFVSLTTDEGDRQYKGSVNFDSLILMGKVTEFAGNQMFEQIAQSFAPPIQDNQEIELTPDSVEVSEPIEPPKVVPLKVQRKGRK